MIVQMEKASASSSRELAQSLYDKNIELENRRRKSAQARVPSDPNAWQQMRENYEAIILEDHNFSEQHNIEYALWQLHYRRIEEFRAHLSAASASSGSTASQTVRGSSNRPNRVLKIRLQFKTFLSEATGFYHDLILKVRAKYGLPIGHLSDDSENQFVMEKDGKKSVEMKKGLISCHRCLIYLGDLARYKGLYGESDSKNRDYAAASSYYLQAASLWPSSGNPHHQLAILATYSGDELVAVYRYFRSLGIDNPFSTARDNLIVAFEKNRQSYFHLHGDSKTSAIRQSPGRTSGRGRGKGEAKIQTKDAKIDTNSTIETTSSIHETYKAFATRFVRLNGILFTRTSLETFGEVLSLVSSALQELLSSGPQEELNFGPETVDNGLVIVRFVSILLFTVNNLKEETEGQSYADIVQRTVLLQNALIAMYELMGLIMKRCLQLSDASSSYLLPGILVFVEWMACSPDIAARIDMDDKEASVRSNFWNHCISFLNKLLSGGLVSVDDEDVTFFNMSRYEEGETDNPLALWEDFELRGFLPLQPAQAFLDFSRKHSLGGESRKEKTARANRILAAGKVLANIVRIDQKTVSFDSKMRKFFIGMEPQQSPIVVSYSGSPKSNGKIREVSTDLTANVVDMQPKAQLYVEGDVEDEVIVFKPTVIEKRIDVASKWIHQEGFERVRTATRDDSQFILDLVSATHSNLNKQNALDSNLQPFVSVSEITPNYLQSCELQSTVRSNQQSSLADGLKSLSFLENGCARDLGTHKDIEVSQTASPSVPFRQSIGVSANSIYFSEAKTSGTIARPSVDTNVSFGGAVAQGKIDTVVSSGISNGTLGWTTCSSMPASSVKVSSNRPVRHLGPPPGFNSVRPRQVNELVPGSSQNPLIDDYSWLDGYQLQSSIKGLGQIQSANQSSNLSSQYISNGNGSLGTNSFPFPGKQVSALQSEEERHKTWQDYQILESLNSHREQLPQQQFIPTPDQQHGQSIWTGHHFV